MKKWIKRWIVRLRLWNWRRRRKRAYEDRKRELREFIYLDEVSVYSLIASRLGPIAAEFTETQTKTLEREFSGAFGADFDVVKSELSPRRLDVKTQGSQVLRKSTIQTTFKEFYDFEKDKLALGLPQEDEEAPQISSLGELIEATEVIESNVWLVDPERITRGQLLEMEVQLAAEPIYHLSAVISAFLEIFEETRDIASLGSYDFIPVRDVEHILTKLLVGLVPVRGEAIDYRIVVLGGKEWIVHRDLLDGIHTAEQVDSRPLFIVGVTEQSLFWKDIRRTLFSNARFRVFCRVAQDGLQDSWMPVKLAQVLETVSPGLAEQINALGENAFASMTNTNLSSQTIEKERRMCKALTDYARLMGEHYDRSISGQDWLKITEIALEKCRLHSSQKERYEAFEAVSTFLLEHLRIERDPEITAKSRELALNNAGLDFSGQIMPFEVSNNPLPDNPLTESAPERQLLDTEFIAVYW